MIYNQEHNTTIVFVSYLGGFAMIIVARFTLRVAVVLPHKGSWWDVYPPVSKVGQSQVFCYLLLLIFYKIGVLVLVRV